MVSCFWEIMASYSYIDDSFWFERTSAKLMQEWGLVLPASKEEEKVNSKPIVTLVEFWFTHTTLTL